ncbi:MAG: DEAD/DEAH box helicase family protein [Bacillota bacterium]
MPYAIIEVDNTRAKITGDYSRSMVDLCTSFFVDGYQYDRAYLKGKWDGRRHLFDRTDETIPTFLLDKVLQTFRLYGVSYEVRDNRTTDRQRMHWRLPGRLSLRDYQEEAVSHILAKKVGIISIGTGGGKTLIAKAATARLGRPTVFFVDKQSLLYQAKKSFEDLGVEVGQVGDGVVDVKDITIAMIQTCVRSLGGVHKKVDRDDEDDSATDVSGQRGEMIRGMLSRASVIFWDECHRVAVETCYIISKHLSRAEYVVGLSATPFREDNADMLLEAITGKVLLNIRSSWLIEHGYLVPPVIGFFEVGCDPKDAVKVYWRGKREVNHRVEHARMYKKYIVQNAERNAIVVEQVNNLNRLGKSCMVVVDRIQHGKYLAKVLGCEFIYGEMGAYFRGNLFSDLQEKRIMRLVAMSKIAGEGLDVPSLDSIVNAGGGKSTIKTLQLVGRALREYPGKKRAYVVDFNDRAKYLVDHTQIRRRIYSSEPAYIVKDVKRQ